MRTMKFFAVCLLALGIIGMCSAKATKPKAKTHEDFCKAVTLALMADKGYSGQAFELEDAFKTGNLLVELNRDNPSWINPATGMTEATVQRGRTTKKH